MVRVATPINPVIDRFRTEFPDALAVLLMKRVEGRPLDAWAWPSARRSGFGRSAGRGLRATHAKLSREAGATAHVIAHQLGHTDTRVTTGNYIGTQTDEAERSRAALRVLQGGRGS